MLQCQLVGGHLDADGDRGDECHQGGKPGHCSLKQAGVASKAADQHGDHHNCPGDGLVFCGFGFFAPDQPDPDSQHQKIGDRQPAADLREDPADAAVADWVQKDFLNPIPRLVEPSVATEFDLGEDLGQEDYPEIARVKSQEAKLCDGLLVRDGHEQHVPVTGVGATGQHDEPDKHSRACLFGELHALDETGADHVHAEQVRDPE